MRSVSVRAFAKINLSLRVKDARPDGFHELQTVYQTVDLYDRVTCVARGGAFELRCTMPGVPTDSANLVWRAAAGLWEAAGRAGEPRGAVVTLLKRIPPQAGLGGGSSNAAAALLALRRLWKIAIPDSDLHRVAAGLGADVPFFLCGGTALGLGRGDEIYRLEPLPRHPAVLVCPPFGVATSDAYRWLDEDRMRQSASPSARVEDRLQYPGLPDAFRNDLEAAVAARYPQIRTIKRHLIEWGAFGAAMSGSGSTVFGVFKSERAARQAARRFEGQGVRAVVARFLGRTRR